MTLINKIPVPEIVAITSFIKNSMVWDVPVGILDNTITVTCVGGGGGGGNGGSTYSSGSYGGGGQGGKNGERKEMTMQVSPGESINITIGAGGKNKSSYNQDITYGGTTTFGDYLSAEGGMGGNMGSQNMSSSSVGTNGDDGYFGGETNISAENGENGNSNGIAGKYGGSGGIGAGAGGGGGGGTGKSTDQNKSLYGGDGGVGASGVVKITYKMRIYKPRGAV